MTVASGCTVHRSSRGIKTAEKTSHILFKSFYSCHRDFEKVTAHVEILIDWQWFISESLTSREHDECVLQHLVRFVSFFVTFFRIHIFLLTDMKMAKCSGECKIRQLGQISVLLKCKK